MKRMTKIPRALDVVFFFFFFGGETNGKALVVLLLDVFHILLLFVYFRSCVSMGFIGFPFFFLGGGGFWKANPRLKKKQQNI